MRRAAPRAELVVDANEGWNADNFEQISPPAPTPASRSIEQPLPEGRDEALARIKRPIPVCADESVHERASLEALSGKYDAVNIKLDKAGGLPRRWRSLPRLNGEAFHHGGLHGRDFVAMAPAMLVAQHAHWVDLDGPLLFAKTAPKVCCTREA